MRFSDKAWEDWLSLPVTQEILRLANEDIEIAKELLTEEEGEVPHAKLRGIIAGLRALLMAIPTKTKEFDNE